MPRRRSLSDRTGVIDIAHSGRIQQRLQLVHSVAKLICAAEFADDFIDVAVIGNGPDFQDVRQRELEFAVGGVFAFPTPPRVRCPSS